MRTKQGVLHLEFGLFVVAGAFLVYQTAQTAALEGGEVHFGRMMVNRSETLPPIALGEIGMREDLQVFVEGQRKNPFAPFSAGSNTTVAMTNVRPRVPVKPKVRRPPTRSVPPPPAKPKPSPPPVTTPQPPKPPAPQPEDTTEPKTPEPWKLPVGLSGVFIVDGERYVVLQNKDTQYYLRAQPGEQITDLGIEIVEIRGEEVILKSLKTGEVFLLRDLLERLRKDSGKE